MLWKFWLTCVVWGYLYIGKLPGSERVEGLRLNLISFQMESFHSHRFDAWFVCVHVCLVFCVFENFPTSRESIAKFVDQRKSNQFNDAERHFTLEKSMNNFFRRGRHRRRCCCCWLVVIVYFLCCCCHTK